MRLSEESSLTAFFLAMASSFSLSTAVREPRNPRSRERDLDMKRLPLRRHPPSRDLERDRERPRPRYRSLLLLLDLWTRR